MTAHIPNHGEHLVRYYGWYSNVSRGKRKKAQPDGSTAAAPEVVEAPLSAPGRAVKQEWARLIKQVYEADLPVPADRSPAVPPLRLRRERLD